jgi:hypothetical protein
MSVTDPTPTGAEGLIARVQAILLSPATEWDKIDAEPATPRGLFLNYACILAAIPAVAGLIGGILFGVNLIIFTIRLPIGLVVANAVVSYVLSLASVFVLALVIDALAPSFGGQKSQIQALKVAIYTGTAGWVAGVFALYTPLVPLAVLGSLYGFYLLYLGLPKLMKVQQDKAVAYTIVTIVVAAILMFVANEISSGLFRSAGTSSLAAAGSHLGGKLQIGGTTVDLSKAEQASKQAQALAESIQAQQNGQPAPAGSIKAVAPDTLKALLPGALPSGFTRTEVEASSAGAAGVSSSNAHGVYAKGDQKITLEVTDMAAMGALAALGGAVNAQSDRETATGYEKMGAVNGRMTSEEFDRQSKTGKFSVVVANRFMVEANGEGVDMDALKAAVASVGFDRLEGLARG